MFSFQLANRCSETSARAGEVLTSRGKIPTPVFMPVGTLGAIKGVLYPELMALEVPITLANTYHLYLRPGEAVLKGAGGLHKFCGWERPILTDSGGFQIFSLAQLSKVSDEGYAFQSHIDGSRHFFTPERALEVQRAIGSDIAMQLDQCLAWGSSPALVTTSVDRTLAWARRSRDEMARHPGPQGDPSPQALFGIVQGEGIAEERARCAAGLVELDLPGYAIGGLSVGENKETLYRVCGETAALLPAQKPRYLMGVGAPEDLVEGAARGIDMFDCVLATRNARNATVYTRAGRLNLRNARHEHAHEPIEAGCPCPACRRHTRAYLRHLFKCDEMNACTLATLHNLAFFQRLMTDLRASILEGRFPQWRADFHKGYRAASEPLAPENSATL
ncbi:MAG: tRNA guanosine(34) transglycosylase Tgt [Spirochaetes bacterium]|nr:tRNA guanosine(34) transglycosylase Tgt [Spirochaetota bacterium]